MTKDGSAEVVQTNDGLKVQQPYPEACKDYVLGASMAFFWMATLCGYAILYKDFLPPAVVHTSVVAFVACSFIGGFLIGIAYTHPVRFYELVEDDPQ